MDEPFDAMDLDDQLTGSHRDSHNAMVALLQLIPNSGGSSTSTTTGEGGNSSYGRPRLAPRTARAGSNLSELILAGHPRRRQTASESDKEKALKEQKRQKTDKVEIEVDLTDSEHEIDKTSLPGQEHQEEHEMAELNDTFPDEDLGKDLKDLLSEEAVSNEGSKTEKREKRGFSLLNFIPNSGWFAPSPGKRPSTSPMRLSPKRTKKDLHNKQKDKLALAVKEANKLKARNFKHPPIKELFSSSSAKASKSSKRRTTTILLETLAGEGRGLPLTTDLLMALASSLKAGGYKAGEGYTAEAKLLHIEEGYQWTDQLDRVFKQCKRALERGRGPRKKAKEVNQEMRRHPKKLSLGQAAKVVKFPALLFVFAMNWMLREIELAAVMTEHIVMNYQNKQVSLRLEVSKTDQEGSGIMRTLQCLCGEKKCHPECPFCVLGGVRSPTRDRALQRHQLSDLPHCGQECAQEKSDHLSMVWPLWKGRHGPLSSQVRSPGLHQIWVDYHADSILRQVEVIRHIKLC